ncbi:uncharacterized protein IL334_007047 [Kwoniella shivajii]|uniref:Protein BFR2 n=1 Tax=Kwoniella shivajii TaxID=564305 RepID=A0ABZ1D832_9TREE|nr:hypothetical protein IL334_007047 [Kwoniella shivajii]
MSGQTLADQLKKLSSTPKNVDPESAYTSLDSLSIPKRDGDEGKEHYLDVGPSRLRMQLNDEEGVGGTLRGSKYQGVTTGRQKIFVDDDDDDDDDDDGEEGGGMAFGDVEGSDEDDEDEDDAEEESEDEDDDMDEDDEEEDDEEEEEEEEDEEEENQKPQSKSKSNKSYDPMASLRDSRLKDIEKGVGIRRQKALFESLLTLRITFQKALSTSTSLPTLDPSDPEGEIATKKAEILKSLCELNERLFTLRENTLLPNVEKLREVGNKRKRDEYDEEEYWKQSAESSLNISDNNHLEMLPILDKWSSKIQAASLQLGSKQAGGSKFLQSIKNGSGGVIEAIEVGLASKRDSDKTLMESEESGYRSLLREVIESRSGSGPAADLSHLRKEKKKKREAERGGSKGRKLRYTVHEKAQNFVVPIPLSNGWHEEQVDELFSSLFGGVGMSGAVAEKRVEVDAGVDGEGLSGLGGLRVF